MTRTVIKFKLRNDGSIDVAEYHSNKVEAAQHALAESGQQEAHALLE